MPRSRASNASVGLWKIILPAVLLCTSVIAQHAQGTPKYDLQTEVTMKGSVEEVKMPPNAKDIVHLVVKTETDTIDLYLCPKSFLADMGVSFSQGDQITLTGSKIKQGDADLVLARQVMKGTDTLVLRDDKGKPVWS